MYVHFVNIEFPKISAGKPFLSQFEQTGVFCRRIYRSMRPTSPYSYEIEFIALFFSFVVLNLVFILRIF